MWLLYYRVLDYLNFQHSNIMLDSAASRRQWVAMICDFHSPSVSMCAAPHEVEVLDCFPYKIQGLTLLAKIFHISIRFFRSNISLLSTGTDLPAVLKWIVPSERICIRYSMHLSHRCALSCVHSIAVWKTLFWTWFRSKVFAPFTSQLPMCLLYWYVLQNLPVRHSYTANVPTPLDSQRQIVS